MNTLSDQLKSLQNNQKILGIMIFSFVTVVIWISISLVTSQTKTAITAESQALAKPLNPSINTSVLETIEQKRLYETTELSEFPIYIILREDEGSSIFDRTDQTLTVQPSSLPAATASPSAQVIPAPVVATPPPAADTSNETVTP